MNSPVTTVQDFLQLETSLNLWDTQVRGVSLWAALREDVMVTINNLNQDVTRIKPRPLQVLKPQLWSMHAKTLAFLGLKQRHTYTNLVVQWAEDRIYPHLYENIAHPLILESSLFGRFDRTNAIHPNREVILHDTIKILERAFGYIIKLKPEEQRIIVDFSDNVATHYNLPDSARRFEHMVITHVKRYLYLKPIFERNIIPTLENKTAFVAIAAYMATKAAMTQILHEADFTVVEAQHGIINRDHIAYTLPEAVLTELTHPSRQYLPDTLLTFGKFWSDNAQIPGEKIEIGFPHLMNRLGDLTTANRMKHKHIMFVSQWTITEQLVKLAIELAKKLPDYHIVYKLHPIEVNMPEKIKPLAGIQNIEVVGLKNVHEVIADAEIIVGYNSTVLFETLAFPDRRIFILENHEMPAETGQFFNTIDELIGYIQDGKSGYPELSPAQVWADDPTTRINRFLQRQGLTS
ncbi:MAG: hypothetical protein ACPG7F_13605 [Aggregatilineales bacterium]